MKKPPYIEIQFPRGKGTLSVAVKRYFNSLEGKPVVLNFGRHRYRKRFSYTVVGLQLEVQEYWPKKLRYAQVRLSLQQVEEKNQAEEA